jgi:glycosyltransferase involved in cell wall biosynthesis
MRVLILHNRYRLAGGEDAVVAAETSLLRSAGIEVVEHYTNNGADSAASILETLKLGLDSHWSHSSYRLVAELCRKHRPDVLHVHNFWMSFSPSVHAAAQAENIATVQTLHNFRLLCTNGLLLRHGKPCMDCVGKVPWRGVTRRCYRNSLVASSAVARMIVTNRAQGTWQHHVNAFIALSEFSRGVLQAGGIPSERMFVKPNFVEDPGSAPVRPSESNVIVFAGRFSEEKGLETLLNAWAQLDKSERGRLLLIGTGPLETLLRGRAASLGLAEPEVVFAGAKPPREVLRLLANARALVQPSVCFENSPRSVLEAFAWGRPVIVSDVGSLREIVPTQLGRRFIPGDPSSLARALADVLRDGELANRLGRGARSEYLARYAPWVNLRQLLCIYEFAGARGRAGIERPHSLAASASSGS